MLLLSGCYYTSPLPEPLGEAAPLPGVDPVLPNAAGCEVFDADLATENRREFEALTVALSEVGGTTTAVDGAHLREFSWQYRRAWTVHRALHVVAGQVTGRGAEAERSAFVEHAQYSVIHDFRGNVSQNILSRESGAGQDRCASRRILASGAFAPIFAQPLTCSARHSVIAYTPTTWIHAEMQDTPATRSAVTQWIEASKPLLHLHAAVSTVPPEISKLGEYAPWSARLSVMQGLASAHGLVEATVRRVESEPSGHRVWVDLDFEGSVDEITDAQLAFECGDPRLLQTGAHLLLPFVLDESDLQPDSIFLIPGLAFDPEGPARRIQRDLAIVLLNAGP